MRDEQGRLLLYAPNVHTGGGLVLLNSLLQSWPTGLPLIGWLDYRAKNSLQLPSNSLIEWVSASLVSRLRSELTLARKGTSRDRILCFHGLPPLLRNKARVIIFQQNRNYLGLIPLDTFSWRTRQRLRFEQVIARLFRERCTQYFVQTPSMARDLRHWYGDKQVVIHVFPFFTSSLPASSTEIKRWDFLYVADGEAHKNHRKLIEAWSLLAEQGFTPSLALTLPNRDASLLGWIQKQSERYGLRIFNLGQLPYCELLSVYGQSTALIFPSISESFGLPLIEARQSGLPILASELDFVRDVCEPVESFDPNSPTSIARAVRRFLGHSDLPLDPVYPSEFLDALWGHTD